MPAKSKAKVLLETSQQESRERNVRFMITTDTGVEYHMEKPESVVLGILDPDVPDTFIEVPVPANLKMAVKHRYLHTTRIGILDLHDELTPDAPAPTETKGG